MPIKKEMDLEWLVQMIVKKRHILNITVDSP